VIIALQFFSPRVLEQTVQRVDGLIYDLKIKLLPLQKALQQPAHKTPHDNLKSPITNIQIVDIDEVSLATIGRMPWPRDKFALLTQKLTQQGAIVIAYDVLFSEKQENPTDKINRILPLLTENEKALLTTAFDDDALFTKALKSNDVVLANLFHHQQNIHVGKLANPITIDESLDKDLIAKSRILSFSGHSSPITDFSNVAIGQGFMNAVTDFDGIVRRSPLVVEFQQQFYPSLALEAFRIYSLADNIELNWSRQSDIVHIQGIKVGKTVVPTDVQGQILIPYRGAAKSYPYTSAADVLAGKINDNRFEQAIVFVGTSAVGLADLRATPVSVSFPGVEINANIFNALMSPAVIPYQPDWQQGAVLILLVLIALISLLVYPNKSALFSLVFSFLLVASTIAFNLLLWRFYSIDLPLATTLLLVVLLSVYYLSVGFFTESNRRKNIKLMFAQYVPNAHIEKLLTQKSTINLDGEKKELTVMFCDVRSFTSISESMTANELKEWLNTLFTPLTNEILQHDGTIDKYVGDMIMAFWGAPIDDENHAMKSIQTAFAMLAAVNKLNVINQQQGKAVIEMGIGINSGEMNVGDMGSDFRRSYTVIGDNVNLASRLESLTKQYFVNILVGEFSKQQAPKFDYLLVDKVNVKGKKHAVKIYTPLEPHLIEQQKQQVELFNKAVNAYFIKKFGLAEQNLLSISSDFSYYSLVELYLSRINMFKLTPPDENWDGSFVHQHK
jgi:adenylate cyclase